MWVVLSIPAAILLYVASYFLTARPVVVAAQFSPTGTSILSRADYRGVPPGTFAPLHFLDRVCIRPKLWNRLGVWPVKQVNGALTNWWPGSRYFQPGTQATATISAPVLRRPNQAP